MNHPRSRVLIALALILSALLTPALTPGPASAAKAAAKTTRMTTTEASYAASVIGLLNRQRASKKVKPLKSNVFLAIAADGHNRAMAAVNVISHLLPGEPAFNVRQWKAGYRFKCWAGENVGVHGAMDRKAALALQTGMFNERPPEDGHRVNILNKHYTEIGVAVLLDKVNHRLWLTLEFGSRC